MEVQKATGPLYMQENMTLKKPEALKMHKLWQPEEANRESLFRDAVAKQQF